MTLDLGRQVDRLLAGGARSRRCSIALLGGIVERFLLRYLYKREELYQLLFTYALVLILGDVCKVHLGHAAALGLAPADAWRAARTSSA